MEGDEGAGGGGVRGKGISSAAAASIFERALKDSRFPTHHGSFLDAFRSRNADDDDDDNNSGGGGDLADDFASSDSSPRKSASSYLNESRHQLRNESWDRLNNDHLSTSHGSLSMKDSTNASTIPTTSGSLTNDDLTVLHTLLPDDADGLYEQVENETWSDLVLKPRRPQPVLKPTGKSKRRLSTPVSPPDNQRPRTSDVVIPQPEYQIVFPGS